jgi:hypothetical protein
MYQLGAALERVFGHGPSQTFNLASRISRSPLIDSVLTISPMVVWVFRGYPTNLLVQGQLGDIGVDGKIAPAAALVGVEVTRSADHDAVFYR